MKPFVTLFFLLVFTKNSNALEASFSYSVSGYNVIFNNTTAETATFTWDFGDGTSCNELHPSHVFSASSSSYLVTLIAQNDCCSDTSTAYISFVCTYAMIAIDVFENDTMLCSNQTTTLIAPFGYHTYAWYIDDVIIPFSNNYTYEASSAGNYRCIMQTISGCGAVSNIIQIHQAPVINAEIVSSQPSIIAGSNVTLSLNNSFESYVWNDGSTDETLQVVNSGDYQVEVKNSIGCSKVLTFHIDIDTASLPVLDLENQNTVSISNIDFTNISSVDWYENGVLYASGVITFFEPLHSATFVANINYINGFASPTNELIFNKDEVLGIENTTNSQVTINNKIVKTATDSGVLNVYNLNGSLIYTNKFEANEIFNFSINTGIYFVNFKSENGKVETKKIQL